MLGFSFTFIMVIEINSEYIEYILSRVTYCILIKEDKIQLHFNSDN